MLLLRLAGLVAGKTPLEAPATPPIFTDEDEMDPKDRQYLMGLDQVDLMARTMWGEARGELEIGRLAVGFVIWNRLTDGRWGKSVREVVLQKWQFSCFNATDPNLPKILALDKSDAVYVNSLGLAQQIFFGSASDPTFGATHYHAVSVRPRWADHPKMRFLCKIRNHLFYREGR